MMISEDKVFQALMRESHLCAEMLCIGTNQLKKSRIDSKGLYHNAFYNIANGLERLGKLILINHELMANKKSIENNSLKKLGHNVTKIVEKVEILSQNYKAKFKLNDIHYQLISFLNDFSKTTRYQNLDSLSGKDGGKETLKEWCKVLSIFEITKRDKKKINKDKDAWQVIDQMTGGVGFTNEMGYNLNSQSTLVPHLKKMNILNKKAGLHIFQIIIFLKDLLEEYYDIAIDKQINIPCYSEILTIFGCGAEYLINRQKLTIYNH